MQWIYKKQSQQENSWKKREYQQSSGGMCFAVMDELFDGLQLESKSMQQKIRSPYYKPSNQFEIYHFILTPI